MKKLFVVLISFFIMVNVYAYGANYEIVMDADSGRVLYGKNINDRALIASTTKIMTALVAINYGNLDNKITVRSEVLEAYGSAIYIKEGEELTLKDLLYGLMLRSGNDAALVIAKNVGGSEEGFVKLMNEEATVIGMKNTTFENPHGLDETTKNYSTVYDMALLMRDAMKNKVFREITSCKKYTLKTNLNTYIWYNKNELLSSYEYATGGKIGYTLAAKHTFVSSATKDNKNLIIATIKDTDRFVTHEKLYEEFFNEYELYTLIDKDNLDIKHDSKYKVYTLSSYKVLLKSNELKSIKREVTYYKDINTNVNGSIIGKLDIYLNDKLLKSMNIYGKEVSSKKESKSLCEKIKEFFKW